MGIRRMDHVGIVVRDLDQAVQFFTTLGLVEQGRATVGGPWVDQIIGLEGVDSDIVMLSTPDGHSTVELSYFRAPGLVREAEQDPVNIPGLRHLCFEVDDLDALLADLTGRGYPLVGDVVAYQDVYRLCYLRGPDGVLVELAQDISSGISSAASELS